MSDHPATTFLNWTSAASVIATLFGWLPSIAALLGVIWYLVLLYDRFISKKRKLG